MLVRCSLLHRPVCQWVQTSILLYFKSVLPFPYIVLKHRVKCYHFVYFSERCVRDRSNKYKPFLIFVCWKTEISELCNTKLSRILIAVSIVLTEFYYCHSETVEHIPLYICVLMYVGESESIRKYLLFFFNFIVFC